MYTLSRDFFILYYIYIYILSTYLWIGFNSKLKNRLMFENILKLKGVIERVDC